MRVLQQATGLTTWRDLFERVAPLVSSARPQSPQMEGAVDRQVLGLENLPSEPFLPAGRRAWVMWLKGGAAHGVTIGSTYALHDAGARRPDEATRLAALRVVEVGALESRTEVVSEAPQLPKIGRAFEIGHCYGDMRLRVALVSGDPARRQQLTAILAGVPIVQLVELDQSPQLLVWFLDPAGQPRDDLTPPLDEADVPTFAVADPAGQLLMNPLWADEPDIEGTLRTSIARIGKSLNVLALENRPPSASSLADLRLLRLVPDADGRYHSVPLEPDAHGDRVLYEGDILAVEVIKRAGQPIYISLFDLGLSWGIAQVFPPERESDRMTVERLVLGLRDGQPLFPPLVVPPVFPSQRLFGLETIKLFATAQESDLQWLAQDSVTKRPPDDPLSQLLASAATGQRDIGPAAGGASGEPAPADWSVAQVTFVLRRGPRPPDAQPVSPPAAPGGKGVNASIFDDTGMPAPVLAEMASATAALPQFPVPADCMYLGLLPSRLRFPTDEKPAGALPRWLVDNHRDAILTRGHVLSAASLAGETVMRRAEEQVGVPALERLVEALSAHGRQWATAPDPAHQSAAEYALTVDGLLHITTPELAQGAFDRHAFDEYLGGVPDALRPQIARRLQGLYNDFDARPRSTYVRTDLLRRYWWAVYALVNARDDVALNRMFVGFKPHLIVDGEAAWDLLYQVVAADDHLRSTVVAFGDFYGLLIGLPNAPSVLDYLGGRMGLGRQAAAAYARTCGQPVYNADSVGLGRSLLPTPVAGLDRTADAIRQREMPSDRLYSPAEFGTLMAAHRLLLGTDYDPGMIRGQGKTSYLDRLMTACAETFASREQPDGRDLADYMALAVAGLSTVDLGREMPRGFAKGIGGPGLYLDPRITPGMVETMVAALNVMRQAVEGLAHASGRTADLGDATATLEALSVLAQMADERWPVPAQSPHFSSLAALDRAGEPKSTLVFSLEQTNGVNMRMSWITIPALVRMSLSTPPSRWEEEHRTEAVGITMLPCQGIVPRVLREDEIPLLYRPLTVEAQGLLDAAPARAEPRVDYHRPLIQ